MSQDKKVSANSDLSLLFENFLKPGIVIKEKEIVPGYTLKVKPLGTGELLMAEAIMDSAKAPSDIVAKVRGASILSQAIISINGLEIEPEGKTAEEIRLRRIELYAQLLKTPPVIVHKSYQFYISCVEEQNKKYENLDEVTKEVENF